jgi:hypothetical protein
VLCVVLYGYCCSSSSSGVTRAEGGGGSRPAQLQLQAYRTKGLISNASFAVLERGVYDVEL